MKREEFYRWQKTAAETAREVYAEYEPDSAWCCPCCEGEGSIRLLPERVEKKRRSRRRRFVKRANQDNWCLELSIGKRPYFERTEQQRQRMADRRKLRYEHDEKLRELVDECSKPCPVCCECEAIDEEWNEKIGKAVESVHEWNEDYARSDDYGSEYRYLVDEFGRAPDAIANWFDHQSFDTLWKELPQDLRERIIERAIDECAQIYVSGYSDGFDCTLDSVTIGEQESEFSLEEFRNQFDLDDCPNRLIVEHDDLRYYDRWNQISIITSNEYDHWSYGFDDTDLASLILECLTEFDGPGLKRREREALADDLREIGGDAITFGETDLAEVWVCYADSINGGNCRPGTRAYMSAHNLSGHYRADLMPEPQLREVRKAIRAAVRRHVEECETGCCELSYHNQGAIGDE